MDDANKLRALLENASPLELMRLRDKYRGDKDIDPLIAPYEHMSFTRDATRNNKLMALPLAVANPLYYLAKQPGLMGLSQRLGLVGQDATPASIDQLFAGWRGIGQGLLGR